ncbi:hypothetical protein SASPL_105141 [Salvia splendens]|uniref:Protein FAR1-RELATED SEQUENCE n=1 Tax=Salvia splendens TaxID=180675 RepID=A0A8X9A920_SALSN|nr:hypothetical protein SASPL_105141 [Salvia splendens]
MSAALASKWLSTYHRLCVWHIFQNAAIHLSSVFSSFKNTFAADFSRCVYDFEEESEFLDAWNEMLEKFNLKDNQWLARMFSLMEKWALVYGRSTFCADIITTQRSECMNAVVKHYVNYKNNIVEVFRHFQRLIDDRREKESIEDLKNAQSSPVMTFPLEILKHAATVYTHKMFALFSEELRKAFESKIESENQLGRKTNNVTVEANKVGDISTNGDINESQIKGVKPKGRVTYQSSKRPKNALEQAISRKRKPKVAKSGLKHVSSTQESEGSKLINNEFWNLTYNVFDNQNVNCYPSESEESDNELIDTELFDENDSVVKEKNIVVYDDITKLLDGCVGHDDNENIFRLCKLWQQCGIHVTIDLFTDSPSDFVDTDSRRSVRGAPGSTGQSLPSESHFGRCHTPAISAASSLSISSDCCGLRGLVVDMTLEFMVELGQVVDMTLALVLVMVEQEGELTEAEQVIVAVVDTILIQDRRLLSILKEFSHFSWLLLLATRS